MDTDVKIEEIKLSLGQKIRTIRLSKKLSQRALAAMAQMDPSHLGKIENAKTDARLTSLFSIIEALGSTPDEFFGDIE